MPKITLGDRRVIVASPLGFMADVDRLVIGPMRDTKAEAGADLARLSAEAEAARKAGCLETWAINAWRDA